MKKRIVDFEILSRLAATTRAYKTGEVIFSAGDPGDEFFVVRDGSVAIRVADKVIETLGRDEIFGEMALVDARPRSATVVAATDCVVVPLSEKRFLLMVQEAPSFALGVMRVLAERLRVANAARRY